MRSVAGESVGLPHGKHGPIRDPTAVEWPHEQHAVGEATESNTACSKTALETDISLSMLGTGAPDGTVVSQWRLAIPFRVFPF